MTACSYKDCQYPGQFKCYGLLPEHANRGQEAWSDTVYCNTHTMLYETRYADVVPLDPTPDSVLRIGVVRRVIKIEMRVEGREQFEHVMALLRALREFSAQTTGAADGIED